MARRVRDYREEYKRRGERAAELEKRYGIMLSSAQARGHPRKGEPSLRQIIRRKILTPAQKYVEVVRLVNTEGQSVTAALKETGLSRSAFKKQNDRYRHFVRSEETTPGKRAYTIPSYRASMSLRSPGVTSKASLLQVNMQAQWAVIGTQ